MENTPTRPFGLPLPGNLLVIAVTKTTRIPPGWTKVEWLDYLYWKICDGTENLDDFQLWYEIEGESDGR